MHVALKSQIPVFLVSIEAVAAGVDVVGTVEGVMDGEGVLRPCSSTLVAVMAACAQVQTFSKGPIHGLSLSTLEGDGVGPDPATSDPSQAQLVYGNGANDGRGYKTLRKLLQELTIQAYVQDIAAQRMMAKCRAKVAYGQHTSAWVLGSFLKSAGAAGALLAVWPLLGSYGRKPPALMSCMALCWG